MSPNFLDLGGQPFANKYPTEDEFTTETIDQLTLDFCDICHSIQTSVIADRGEMFEEYFYLSSVNEELRNHFSELAKSLTDKKFVVDVGSNDGILLRPLRQLRVACIGIDPSENVSEIANKEGLTTITSFFDLTAAQVIELQHGKPDCIVAASVFTHLESPEEFFEVADQLIEDSGELIIEIEDPRRFASELKFERFYFDRPHYYSIKGCQMLASRFGFKLKKCVPINVHGGSIRLIFGRTAMGHHSPQDFLDATKESFRNAFIQWVNEGKAFRDCLVELKKSGKPVVGYGAPARLATITNYFDIGPELIDYIIDDNALKQNKFSPGMHIPIRAYDESLLECEPVIVVFAYEYIESIRNKLSKFNGLTYYQAIPFTQI